MKRDAVTLDEEERAALTAVTQQGSHRSQKVINALGVLNCNAGVGNERTTGHFDMFAAQLS